ncbi:ferritin heavy chain B-like [Heteronotia binoei]|uniref:ferritin heavy chain B-like n=1 Tax=Heteronotia binoei TaxID=13085 RepID=UPI00292D73DF|nr:ferritin heavy chain B-like [Heteronotia binoei]
MDSQTRQNYHPDCEFAVNQMVNMELHASLVYLSMAYYFQRDDVALKHMATFLEEESFKKRENAEKLLKHQNKRGGHILLHDIKKPEQDEWGTSLGALQSALKLEKNINQALLDLHCLAIKEGDPQLCDFLKSHFLMDQVQAIKQLGDHLSNLKRLRVPHDGMGEHLFDKLTLGDS